MADELRNKDDAKGRLKEAAGSLSGDCGLKREGQVDRAAGKAKQGTDRLAEKVKENLGRN